MDWNVLLAIALFFLPCLLALKIIFRKRKARQESRRVPFPELQRRPAGEALRLKLQELDEKIQDDGVGFAAVPALVGFLFLVLHGIHWSMVIVCFVICVAAAVFFGMRLLRLAEIRSNYRLGFEGERYVGEELSRLIALGFEVYHDVPFDGFNIDHVLVGSRGIFAVETKTRRQPAGVTADKRPRVEFDGEQLNWPWGSDRNALQQSKRHATTLGEWLRREGGLEKIWVIGIVTMPGWQVDRSAWGKDVHVFSPEHIYDFCSVQREALNEGQIRSICEKLNYKCRIAVN